VDLLDPKRLELFNTRLRSINTELERNSTLRQQQPAAAAEADQKVRLRGRT